MIWKRINDIQAMGETIVVVTVAGARGSVPGEVGAKAIITATGLVAGTLGGGKVEAKAITLALGHLANPEFRAETITWNLQKDVQMTCGGEMTFVFERISALPSWHIAIFGAGHVAAALVPLLTTLNCLIDLIDPRPDWLGKIADHPKLRKHDPQNYEDRVDLVTPTSFVLCLSKGHSTDRPVLRDIFRNHPNIAFIGVIGSASKRAVLLRELKEDGIPEETSSRLVCPLGLPIGRNNPAEIAISIAAQLLQEKSNSAKS